MTRKTAIVVISSSLIGGVAIVVIAGKIHRNKLLAAVNKQLDADLGSTAQATIYDTIISPNFYRGYVDVFDNFLFFKGTSSELVNYQLETSTIDKIADAIYNSHSVILPDDQATIMANMNALRSQIQVSVLADEFQKRHGTALSTFLKNNLSTGNFNLIKSTLSGLPLGNS